MKTAKARNEREAILNQAITEKKAVRFRYVNAEGKRHFHSLIWPKQLHNYTANPYFTASCTFTDDIRNFRLDPMTDLRFETISPCSRLRCVFAGVTRDRFHRDAITLVVRRLEFARNAKFLRRTVPGMSY